MYGELFGSGDGPTVEQEHYAKEQDERGREQREDSVIEGALPGLAEGGGGGVTEGAALGEGALRGRKESE
jgi:hypothetical protein